MSYIELMAKYKSERLNKLQSQKGVNRGPVSLYLDKDLYARFKEVIGDLAASEVIEDFMRDTVETETGEKKRVK